MTLASSGVRYRAVSSSNSARSRNILQSIALHQCMNTAPSPCVHADVHSSKSSLDHLTAKRRRNIALTDDGLQARLHRIRACSFAYECKAVTHGMIDVGCGQ